MSISFPVKSLNNRNMYKNRQRLFRNLWRLVFILRFYDGTVDGSPALVGAVSHVNFRRMAFSLCPLEERHLFSVCESLARSDFFLNWSFFKTSFVVPYPELVELKHGFLNWIDGNMLLTSGSVSIKIGSVIDNENHYQLQGG